MSEWQDISTAPIDGTVVLVWSNCFPIAAMYAGHSYGWELINNTYSENRIFLDVEPTHWMPMPKPPKP